MRPRIKTRFLIMSDTHGMKYDPTKMPEEYADVAIHCGDLTDGSKLSEFQNTIRFLQNTNAALKLAIAGNHDFTMDIPAFEQKVQEATPTLDPELVAKEYGLPGQARQLFKAARAAGIIFLDEGTHQFELENGASLTVYASPYTPSMGAWGFQYSPDKGHDFDLDSATDVVVTHGPPRGIMDYTHGRERAGCPILFEAIAKAKPRLHCFGHIHEGWGAKLVTWRGEDVPGAPLTHFTAIDNDKSAVIEKLASLRPSKFAAGEDVLLKLDAKMKGYAENRCCKTSHCVGDEFPIVLGRQTLFVNASLQGDDGQLSQWPWMVDMELSSACEAEPAPWSVVSVADSK